MKKLKSTIALSLMAGGLAWWFGQNEPEIDADVTTEGESLEASEPVSTTAAQSREPTSVDGGAVVKPVPSIEVIPTLSEKAKESLGDFRKIKATVLATSDDAEEQNRSVKSRLFQDRQLMKELEVLLKAPARGDQELAAQQMAALDLLFEAIDSKNTGLPSLAVEVLSSIIEDRTIEDDTVDSQSRQSLAQVKAEVLYRWSATEPQRADQIMGLLPGPVSRKIWGNVVETQAQNVAESQFELENQLKTRSTSH